jgi:2-amino-4-hydroxy-6-hydroxymethyldihydropteridine diphosphokinase
VANRAYIGLGSNLGDRLDNLQRAVDLLIPAAFPRRVSGVYESEPWAFVSAFKFLNAVVEVETEHAPRELLTELHKIEYVLGRERPEPDPNAEPDPEREYHDRMIDLDLLWYQDFEFESGSFTVPHPWATIRAFVLKPWAELDRNIRLRGIKIPHWLESLPDEETDKTRLREDLRLRLPVLDDLLGGLQVP